MNAKTLRIKKENIKNVLFLILLILFFSLETTFFQNLPILGATPQLTLAAFCLIALNRRPIPAALFGAFCGMLLDYSRFHRPGFSLLFLFVLGIFLSLCYDYFLRRTLLNAILMFSLANLLHTSFSSIVYVLIWDRGFPAAAFGRLLLGETFYGAALTVPLYFVFKSIEDYFAEPSA